ncbi:unknown similar to AMEV034 [Adoxophyes honmai entomopoxvirus 'L']|uniref:Uncharacterized protein n=1 Tax=Adoxophyes honmai entomopoxvirus 'L' TaxID=1293540 RepID=A0A916KNX4_9POXV|nr:unknown similar to AMEV034 [Adoxophyes honmai entomopoxvirus 'L']CCU55356.1 unknown similar to AMEV034 [Adoxophyes honmai entomopoxvirus 'L']
MENQYLLSGTLIGFNDNEKIIIELSNIDGHTIYNNITNKIVYNYDKNVDISDLIDDFKNECKLNNCKYITTSSIVFQGYLFDNDDKIHLELSCDNINNIPPQLKKYISCNYNLYNYLKKLNLFCDKCYDHWYYDI